MYCRKYFQRFSSLNIYSTNSIISLLVYVQFRKKKRARVRYNAAICLRCSNTTVNDPFKNRHYYSPNISFDKVSSLSHKNQKFVLKQNVDITSIQSYSGQQEGREAQAELSHAFVNSRARRPKANRHSREMMQLDFLTLSLLALSLTRCLVLMYVHRVEIFLLSYLTSRCYQQLHMANIC